MARINALTFHGDPEIESICRLVREAGFDSLEVSRPPFYEKLRTPALRRTFVRWAGEQGLSLYGFDAWVEVEPYEQREQTLEGFRHAVDWASDLELGMLISHDPWPGVHAGRDPEECLKINTDFFRQVAECCVSAGLRLVVEPHPDTLSMRNAWAIRWIDALREGLPPGAVGLVYDCCHYGVGQPDRYIESIAELGDRITHLHFSDGDRQTYALHLPLGDGSLDLDAIVAALRGIGYAGTLTNDLYSYPLPRAGARRNAVRIRQIESDLGIRG